MRFPIVCLFLSIAVYAISTKADAAPTAPDTKQVMTANATAVEILPHRAIYDIALSSVKNGSNITDVSGKMIFEWSDACDGWANQQNLQLHFTYAEGDQSNVASNEVTWESKDGKHYNFNIRRMNDGKETENYRGKANVSGGINKAIYTMPEGKSVVLTAETVFPSSHTRMIITHALAGDHFFSRRVFDGTDEAGSNDVSVFIGAAKMEALDVKSDDNLTSNPLLAKPMWPVHMAFFKMDDVTGTPDYEMDLKLLSNGIVRTMKIDYGDFSVTGNLKAIEPLPSPHC